MTEPCAQGCPLEMELGRRGGGWTFHSSSFGVGLEGQRTDRFTCPASQQPVGRHFCHSENKAVKHLSLPDKQTVAPSSAVLRNYGKCR